MRNFLALGFALLAACAAEKVTIPGCTAEQVLNDGIQLEGVKSTLREAERLRQNGHSFLSNAEKAGYGIPCASGRSRADEARTEANTKVTAATTALGQIGACVAAADKQDLEFKIRKLNEAVTRLEGLIIDFRCSDAGETLK